MNSKRMVALCLLAVGIAAGLGVGQLEPISRDGNSQGTPSHVSIQAVAEHPKSYVGEQITIDGWYQGGTVRDRNPLCANTQGGRPTMPYNHVFIDITENTTLYTGEKYRITGSLKASVPDRAVPRSKPVLVPEKIVPLNETAGGSDCPTATPARL